ncbi:MAG: hypothetical protein J5769_07315 [Bacteroidales bacterium]|nr:hypothetical protein [Bacteroidales bacterium]
MHAVKRLFPVFLLIPCLSCSFVKEDRELCPCNLTIEVAGAPGPVRLLVEGPSFERDSTVAGDTSVTWRVPRPDVRITAVCGAEWNRGVVIADGCECPPLYLGVGRVETNSENATCVPPLNKAYCQIDMQFKCPAGWKPLPVAVTGNICGYSASGNPAPGAFRCEAEPSGVTGRCRFRIPRQRDASLLLTIGSSWTFALGEYLRQTGYNWNEPDLQDVQLDIDISLTDITFRSASWTHTEKLWFLI